VNLTQKYLRFPVLPKSMCFVSYGSICDRDVTVQIIYSILRKIYHDIVCRDGSWSCTSSKLLQSRKQWFLSNVISPWLYQNAVLWRTGIFAEMLTWFFCFCNNILFLISLSWSLLCEFNTKIFTFTCATKVHVLC